MKLDTHAFRYLTNEDWRVLSAVEQGSKNHEIVPTPLIQQIASLRGGSGVHKCISALAKVGLIGRVKNARYDGYRLTYGGLDYLALHTHLKSSTLYSLGNQIGVGKESDIYISSNPQGRNLVLKLHRLGRISFRAVKANRDYLRNRTTGSWMYLSRLAAQKEYSVMRVLWREGFSVPEPVGWSRHTVVMEFVDALPLRMVEGIGGEGDEEVVGRLYGELMAMIVALAKRGLIHGDFNEFNILIRESTSDSGDGTGTGTTGKEEQIRLNPVMIDFPQVISTNHVNAEMYFARDVECVKRYFERRFKYVSEEEGPVFGDVVVKGQGMGRLDVEVEASGYSRKMARELGRYVEATEGDEREAEVEEDEENGEDEDGATEGEQAESETAEHDGGREDSQLDDPKLIEKVGSQSLGEDFAVKPVSAADYGLMPLAISHDPDVVAERIHGKKKASGWAI